MFDENQKSLVMQAYNFANDIGSKHLTKIETEASEEVLLLLNKTTHSEDELKQRLTDLAIEYHNHNTPSLVSNLEDIETVLKLLITKLNSLKNTAPDIFDDIAEQMYNPYLRTGKLKPQEFEYHPPQMELQHLLRAVNLTTGQTQQKKQLSKKRGRFWPRVEQLWGQITHQKPEQSQNSNFIQFAEIFFNSGEKCDSDYENAEALSRSYRRYLNKKSTGQKQ